MLVVEQEVDRVTRRADYRMVACTPLGPQHKIERIESLIQKNTGLGSSVFTDRITPTKARFQRLRTLILRNETVLPQSCKPIRPENCPLLIGAPLSLLAAIRRFQSGPVRSCS